MPPFFWWCCCYWIFFFPGKKGSNNLQKRISPSSPPLPRSNWCLETRTLNSVRRHSHRYRKEKLHFSLTSPKNDELCLNKKKKNNNNFLHSLTCVLRHRVKKKVGKTTSVSSRNGDCGSLDLSICLLFSSPSLAPIGGRMMMLKIGEGGRIVAFLFTHVFSLSTTVPEQQPNQQRTLNKLPTELRRRNFVNKHRLSVRIDAKTCKKRVRNTYTYSDRAPILHTTVGGWEPLWPREASNPTHPFHDLHAHRPSTTHRLVLRGRGERPVVVVRRRRHRGHQQRAAHGHLRRRRRRGRVRRQRRRGRRRRQRQRGGRRRRRRLGRRERVARRSKEEEEKKKSQLGILESTATNKEDQQQQQQQKKPFTDLKSTTSTKVSKGRYGAEVEATTAEEVVMTAADGEEQEGAPPPPPPPLLLLLVVFVGHIMWFPKSSSSSSSEKKISLLLMMMAGGESG